MTKLDIRNLKTTNQEPIQILKPGIWNQNAGPDFLDARIKIGNTTWAGNVEIHIKSSDWLKHKHQNDSAYNNVILHVVLEADRPITRKNGEEIPCLALKEQLDQELLFRYNRLMQQQSWIPCGDQCTAVPSTIRNNMLDRVLVERFEQKVEKVAVIFKQTKYDWEATFFHLLGRSFGGKVNADTFGHLIRSTTFNLLRKYAGNQTELEALLFGMAGLLEEEHKKEEEYVKDLNRRFYFLKGIHELQPQKREAWKFSRMRPANFPTVRIAQFAALFFKEPNLAAKILKVKNLKEIEKLFCVCPSVYWETHYQLNKKSISKAKTLGRSTVFLMIINSVLPYLYYFSIQKANEKLRRKVLEMLEEIPPEQNTIIRNWKLLEFNPSSAYESQALIHLKQEYCNKKKCLSCTIGNYLLSKNR